MPENEKKRVGRFRYDVVVVEELSLTGNITIRVYADKMKILKDGSLVFYSRRRYRDPEWLATMALAPGQWRMATEDSARWGWVPV
jgi:hypothetical protein